jgi:hypothetical protein
LPFNTTGRISASQHKRRTVETSSGIPLSVSQIDCWWTLGCCLGVFGGLLPVTRQQILWGFGATLGGELALTARDPHLERRPLSEISKEIRKAGFAIDVLAEPMPVDSLVEIDPSTDENLRTRPHFLFVRAVPRHPA